MRQLVKELPTQNMSKIYIDFTYQSNILKFPKSCDHNISFALQTELCRYDVIYPQLYVKIISHEGECQGQRSHVKVKPPFLRASE